METIGALLRINLAKNLPKPKAVAELSTSKILAFAATNKTPTPETPERHAVSRIGKAIESVF